MSKWWLPLILLPLMLLSACSGNSPDKSYYQLPLAAPASDGQHTAAKSGDQRHPLWLERITLPDFLTSGGLVYQTSEVNYVIASNNLWASPLDQQLASSLVNGLNRLLPDWLVSTTPLSDQQGTLSLNITGFHGRYDGHVIVSGNWLVKYQRHILQQPFYIDVTQQQDGYPAMVNALAQAWRQEIKNIASQLQQLD